MRGSTRFTGFISVSVLMRTRSGHCTNQDNLEEGEGGREGVRREGRGDGGREKKGERGGSVSESFSERNFFLTCCT